MKINEPRTVRNKCEVVGEEDVKGRSGVEDNSDTIEGEVAEALATETTRGGMDKDKKVTDVSGDFSADGEQPVGIASFTVVVQYATLENDLEAAA